MHVRKVWDMIWPSNRFDISLIQNFKKALETFFTANRMKTFQRLFSYNSGCKGRLWAIFLPRVHQLKKANIGKPALHVNINLRFKLEDSGFLETLVFVNENCCLCMCFTELYLYYWLCHLFSLVHEHRLQEYSKCRAYKTLLKITHCYKTYKTIK